MTQIAIVVLGLIAMGVASALPPILAAMNWLFSWLVPVFWVVVFGLFWKRSATVALATLLSAWTANLLWSFSGLPALLHADPAANAYVVLGVTLVVGVAGNLLSDGEAGYFRPQAA